MGLLDLFKRRGPGRRRAAPSRDTVSYPTITLPGQVRTQPVVKPTPRNLRYFSRTPYARRAINAIKNPVAMLDWEVGPIDGVENNKELDRQIEVATRCLTRPNEDDSFRTLVEQVIEDVLLGAGAMEQQIGSDALRPLWIWPVDGLSIQIYPAWSGDLSEARYVQTLGYGTLTGTGQQIPLRNDELIYLRPNPSTASPFGLGPLEVAFNSVSRLLGVGEFAGNLASNARPSIGIDLGSSASPEVVAAFRSYWRNEVEGQGNVPITGINAADKSSRGMSVHRFYPEGDAGLYLQYQEFLKREIAAAFDLSPQNLGVERDINRNTAEVGEDRDRDNVIRPYANLIASHLTRETIQGRLGFSQLEFRFVGIDREDEEATSRIFERYYRNNLLTPNEHRDRLGMGPAENDWGDKTFADMEIAKEAARGAARVIDKELGEVDPPSQPKNQERNRNGS